MFLFRGKIYIEKQNNYLFQASPPLDLSRYLQHSLFLFFISVDKVKIAKSKQEISFFFSSNVVADVLFYLLLPWIFSLFVCFAIPTFSIFSRQRHRSILVHLLHCTYWKVNNKNEHKIYSSSLNFKGEILPSPFPQTCHWTLPMMTGHCLVRFFTV